MCLIVFEMSLVTAQYTADLSNNWILAGVFMVTGLTVSPLIQLSLF